MNLKLCCIVVILLVLIVTINQKITFANDETSDNNAKKLITLAVNNAPTANSGSVSLDEDSITGIFLSGSDPDGDSIRYSIVNKPSHGKLSGLNTQTGFVVYVPDKDYNGADSLTFKVSDNLVTSTPATISITINPIDETQSGFGEPVNISKNPKASENVKVAASDDDVILLWDDETGSGFNDIFFTKSTNRGLKFTTKSSVHIDGQDQFADILLVDKNLYTSWMHVFGSPFVFFGRSTNGGASFDKILNLSGTGDAWESKVAVSGNDVYVVWYQKDDYEQYDIFMAKSTNNGASFSSKVNISNNSGGSVIPQIAVSGNTVYLVWFDATTGNTDILFTKSIDGGQTFSTPVNVSNDITESARPKLAVDGNNIYISWYGYVGTDENDADIYFAKSTDNGATFGTPVNISSNTGLSFYQNMVISGDNVYLAWFDNASGVYDVLFAKSTDGGTTFGTPIKIQSNSGDSIYPPKIIPFGDKLHLFWNGYFSVSYDIFYTKSTDNGETFESPINLTHNPGESYGPEVAVSDETMYLTWFDSTPGNNDVFFTYSVKPFEIAQNGTATLAAQSGDFSAGSHTIDLQMSGSYNIIKNKPKITTNSLSGALTIDKGTEKEKIIDLKNITFKLSNDLKTITFTAKPVGQSGAVSEKLVFDPAITFGTNQDSVDAKNILKITLGKTKLDTKNTSTGKIDFN